MHTNQLPGDDFYDVMQYILFNIALMRSNCLDA